MKRMLAIILSGVTLTLGMASLSSQASASTTKTAFSNIKADSTFEYNQYTKVTTYHAKSIKQSAYIWNDTHTKKLSNLKSHPTYTWFQTATATKGNAKWIQVSNQPQTIKGWIWSGYLKKGYNTQGYQIISKRFGPGYGEGYYHVTNPQKNAYLWDWSHTKKRVNLKHYLNQSLLRSHTVVMQHNGQKGTYYYTTVKTAKGDVSGYVSASLVEKGYSTYYAGVTARYPLTFATTANYLDYIKQSKYQKLTQEIMALFPNTPVDLGLSQIAAYTYGAKTIEDGDSDLDPLDQSGYTDIVPFKSVIAYLYNHRTASNATKIAGVKKLLAAAGYPAAKRAKLTDYKLGIYNINNISIYNNGEGKTAWYSLAIGKTN
ncbi:hypothetical protein [Secundilactobacillus muriivasis]